MLNPSDEQSDFWEGYRAALIMLNVELDTFLLMPYNDRRIQNGLLDLKIKIKEMLTNNDEETMAINL